MGEISNNEPCPCGSGKKYKKCCKFSEPEKINSPLVLPNIYQIITLKFFQEGYIDLEKELVNYQKSVFTLLPDLEKTNVDILTDYINICENIIAEIATKYSIYDMLFWSRRLGPKNLFGISEHSVRLYREIQALCIYKYGKNDSEISMGKRNMVFPSSLNQYEKPDYAECVSKIYDEDLPQNIVNLLSDVIRIEILSYLFLVATQLYRIGNKEDAIIVDKTNNLFLSDTSNDIGFLIDMYDERLKYANLFSSTGTYLSSDIKLDIDIPFFCPYFQLNVDHKTKIKAINPNNKAYQEAIPDNKELEILPNYLFAPINLKDIYNYLELFEDEFEDFYCFSVKEFIVFLGYLGNKVIRDISINLDSQISILNRAYIIANYDIDSFGEECKELAGLMY